MQLALPRALQVCYVDRGMQCIQAHTYTGFLTGPVLNASGWLFKNRTGNQMAELEKLGFCICLCIYFLVVSTQILNYTKRYIFSLCFQLVLSLGLNA
jgi:hypothetical protein